MSYVDPAMVLAPRSSVRSVEVLYNSKGSGGWSVARVRWEGPEGVTECVGIRWNGSDESPGIGNPQSRGNATWFILPEELEAAVLEKVDDLTMSAPGGLLERYREMASDTQQETEAKEWSEGLIGDASTEG